MLAAAASPDGPCRQRVVPGASLGNRWQRLHDWPRRANATERIASLLVVACLANLPFPAMPCHCVPCCLLACVHCLALPCLALPCLASVASFVSLSFSTIVRSQKVPRRENEALQRILARISNDGRGGVVVTWQMTLRLVII